LPGDPYSISTELLKALLSPLFFIPSLFCFAQSSQPHFNMTYSPPSSAKPFTLNIPDKDLSEWRQLLQLSKLGPTTYENTQTKENYGVTKEWVSNTKDYWLNKYDWRAEEKRINSFSNFKMQIEGIDMHFIGLFSEHKDAIPIVFIHGWPGSFIEFLPMLEVIKKQYEGKELPYHLIVPSLPGYTLSTGLPTDQNWTMQDSARIINTLMKNLGFNKYLAQGGDVGSFESRILAHTYDECVGIHRTLTSDPLHMNPRLQITVNMFVARDTPDESKMTATEKAGVARSAEWMASGRGYNIEHGTRPSTIGHVLSSNPLALLAWYVFSLTLLIFSPLDTMELGSARSSSNGAMRRPSSRTSSQTSPCTTLPRASRHPSTRTVGLALRWSTSRCRQA
jgi:pimeloyl-ACP methyl ester carboxylesterase